MPLSATGKRFVYSFVHWPSAEETTKDSNMRARGPFPAERRRSIEVNFD